MQGSDKHTKFVYKDEPVRDILILDHVLQFYELLGNIKNGIKNYVHWHGNMFTI